MWCCSKAGIRDSGFGRVAPGFGIRESGCGMRQQRGGSAPAAVDGSFDVALQVLDSRPNPCHPEPSALLSGISSVCLCGVLLPSGEGGPQGRMRVRQPRRGLMPGRFADPHPQPVSRRERGVDVRTTRIAPDSESQITLGWEASRTNGNNVFRTAVERSEGSALCLLRSKPTATRMTVPTIPALAKPAFRISNPGATRPNPVSRIPNPGSTGATP